MANINELPEEIQSKVFKFMSHPVADIIRDNFQNHEDIGFKCFKVRTWVRVKDGSFVFLCNRDMPINHYTENYWNWDLFKYTHWNVSIGKSVLTSNID